MKKTFLFSIILLVSLVSYTLHSYADDPMAMGNAAYEKGDYQSAIKSFKEAIKEDKKNPQAYYWLGAAYLRADSLEQAVGASVQSRELDPQNKNIFEQLGDIYAAQKIYAAAIDQYKKVLEFEKKNAPIYLKIGELSRKSRLYTEAAESYINVLLIDSTNMTALKELATIYFRAKQYANALPLFKQLVAIKPDTLIYKINFVKCLYETKYFKELVPVADDVLSKDSTLADVEKMRLDALFEIKDYARLEQLFLKYNPDSLSAIDLIKRGKAQRTMEKMNEAIDSYERAFRKDSSLSDIYYDLGTLYMRVKRYTDAVAMFDRKVASDTSSGYRFACYLNSAMSLMQVKDFKKAKEYIQKSIEYKPDNMKAWLTLAQCNGQLGITNEQGIAYRKVIELALAAADTGNGDRGKYKAELEEAYRMEGFRLITDKKFAESIEFFKKALQFNPKDCLLLLLTGQAYHNNKNEAEAKQYYCKVLQLCPKSDEGKKAEVGIKLMGEECGK